MVISQEIAEKLVYWCRDRVLSLKRTPVQYSFVASCPHGTELIKKGPRENYLIAAVGVCAHLRDFFFNGARYTCVVGQ